MMRPTVIVLTACLAATAFAAPPRFAVVRAGTELGRLEDAATFKFSGATRTVQVVGAKDGYTHVRLNTDHSDLCYDTLFTGGVPITLRIKDADLSPVVIREYARKLTNGTKVFVRPGVAATRAGAAYTLDYGPFKDIGLPPDIVRRSYLSPGPPNDSPFEGTHLRDGAILRLGDVTWKPPKYTWGFSLVSQKGAKAIVQYRMRCARYWLTAKSSDLQKDSNSILGMMGGLGTSNRVRLKPDTLVTWPDGSRAGTSDRLHKLGWASSQAKTEKCYRVSTSLKRVDDPKGSLVLCIPKSAILAK